MSIISSSYQHCDEQQFQALVLANTRLYILSLEMKYAFGSRASCFYIDINIFEHFEDKIYNKKYSVS